MEYRNNDLLARITAINAQSDTQFKPIYQEMNKNYNMTVSRLMWDEADRVTLNEQGRPANAYNLISGVIKHMTSLENKNRRGIQAVGRTHKDQPLAKTFTSLIMFHLQKAGFDKALSRAFLDGIIAKWGVLKDGWVFDNDLGGRFSVKAINPMEVKFELGFSDFTLDNCSYVIHSPYLSIDEIIMHYASDNKELQGLILQEAKPYIFDDMAGNKAKKFLSTAIQKLMNSAMDFLGGSAADEMNRNLYNDAVFFRQTDGKFLVTEMHERRTERRMLSFDIETNQKVDITEEVLSADGYNEENELVQKVLQTNPNYTEPFWDHKPMTYITAAIPALNILPLDAPYAVQNKQYSITLVPAYDFHADMGNTQSVVDELIDPQSDYNKRRSTMLEMLMRYSNLGYLVEDDAITGYEEDFESPKIGGIKRVKSGRMSGIKPEEMPQIPQELVRDAMESKDLIEYISKVTKVASGQQESANEPAKLFLAKNDNQLQMIQHLYDNLESARLMVARNCLANIQRFQNYHDAIRITDDPVKPEFLEINKPQVTIDDQGNLQQEIINDVTVGEFDIIISTAPYTSSARELDYMKLINIFDFATKYDPMAAQKMFPILVKASETSYATEILEALGGEQTNPQLKAMLQEEAQREKEMQRVAQEQALQNGKVEIINKKLEGEKIIAAITNLRLQGEKIKKDIESSDNNEQLNSIYNNKQ